MQASFSAVKAAPAVMTGSEHKSVRMFSTTTSAIIDKVRMTGLFISKNHFIFVAFFRGIRNVP